MKYPGDYLQRIAARVFNETTMERVIGPVLADLQAEHARAIEHGLVWASRWIRLAGCVALLKVVVFYAYRYSVRTVSDRDPYDRPAVRRAVGWSVAATAVAMLAMLLPVFLRNASLTLGTRLTLLMYVVPSQVPLALPIGVLLGVPCGLKGLLISRRSQGVVLAIALGCSVASFVTMAWILPAANEAFRFRATAAFRAAVPGGVNVVKAPLPPGANELTLAELSQRIDTDRRDGLSLSGSARLFALAYHTRWALACAPLVLAFFALSLVSRHRSGRFALGVAACGAFLCYYLFLYAGRASALAGLLPVSTAAWLPNAMVFGISVAVLRLFPHRSNATAHP